MPCAECCPACRRIHSVNEDQLTARQQRAWRTYLSANVQLMERLDQELQQRSNLTLTDYEILLVLSVSPDRRLRMSDLARQVLVSRSRLTYRVDRLAETNYVTREECEDDRRGLWAILTDTGLEALRGARPDHELDLKTFFFDLMNEDELYAMERVMARVDDKLSTNR